MKSDPVEMSPSPSCLLASLQANLRDEGAEERNTLTWQTNTKDQLINIHAMPFIEQMGEGGEGNCII